ncbi:MgtC/SapB family protein [Aurantiacibacter poecillastricola]|uniref:MgtC/SapB family protein n=1 Tax=Aurantiacibacter poecillastricola TaxID=3064385 RepID=UPI00273FF785|nr:MgtC/SapB family protein [Aurantiacibacter sp. 219JJ12-13]MDP5261842.1 MgtC/SapB family protein [Aurantiacibacter sp. 219JJ12-13]
MILNPATPLSTISFDLVLRLGAATAIGLTLGLDRQFRGHAAGLRTHGIVCLASAAMLVSAIALYHQIGGERMDPLRLFEATGAFIGIVGAGLVVFARGELRNVTTAVHLWLTAVIGLACGAGQWPIVVICASIAVVLMVVMGYLERNVLPKPRSNTKDGDKPRSKP